MTLAPIILFVYNRPWHTQQALEALSRNQLADSSCLYIFADGAKPDAQDERQVNEVREVIRKKKWCGEVHLVESPANKGLTASVVGGVSEVINRYGKVIVLEDDILPSPGFLKYMNEALDMYAHEEKAMHISAYSPPVKAKLPDLFFYEVMHCWGWGTWKRAWDKRCTSDQYIYQQLQELKKEKHFDLDNSRFFLPQLKNNVSGRSDTWDISWYGSIYLNGGYCLTPGTSLVQNIGFDGSGSNCLNLDNTDWPTIDFLRMRRVEIKSSASIRKVIRDYYRYGGKTFQGHYYATFKGWLYRKIKKWQTKYEIGFEKSC